MSFEQFVQQSLTRLVLIVIFATTIIACDKVSNEKSITENVKAMTSGTQETLRQINIKESLKEKKQEAVDWANSVIDKNQNPDSQNNESMADTLKTKIKVYTNDVAQYVNTVDFNEYLTSFMNAYREEHGKILFNCIQQRINKDEQSSIDSAMCSLAFDQAGLQWKENTSNSDNVIRAN